MSVPAVASAPGWYADPAGEGAWRWWDGAGWTPLVHPPHAAASRRASFGARAYGYLLDALGLWLVSLVCFHPFHRPVYDELNGLIISSLLTQGAHWPGLGVLLGSGLPQLWLVAAIPGVLLRVGYDVLMLRLRGATWGHRQAGIVVRSNRPAGQVDPRRPNGLSWRQALVRSLVLRVSAPTCLAWLLVVLWPLGDREQRSLADVLAGTRVDEAPQAWPGWRR